MDASDVNEIRRCFVELLKPNSKGRTPWFAHLAKSPFDMSALHPSSATSSNTFNTDPTVLGSLKLNAKPEASPGCGVGPWPMMTTLMSLGATNSKALNVHGIGGSIVLLLRSGLMVWTALLTWGSWKKPFQAAGAQFSTNSSNLFSFLTNFAPAQLYKAQSVKK